MNEKLAKLLLTGISIIVVMGAAIIGVSKNIMVSGADNPTPPIVYVARDGSGDFNCDGVSDQVEINEAIDFVATHENFTTVYLKAGTYIIDEPIVMQSNVTLTGDATTKIKLKDYVNWWTKNKPMITQKGTTWDPWGNENDSICNVEIYGFEIDGGIQLEPTGQNYIPLIHFKNPYNVSIHDMYLHDSRWDIIRLTASAFNTSIKARVYNNRIEHSGHEGICFVAVTDFEAYNNSIYRTRTNSGIRAKDCNNFSIYGNKIGNSLTRRPSGYAGIQIENEHVPISKAEIYNNFIYGKVGGIILTGEEGVYKTGTRKGVHIHHNIIYRIRKPYSKDIPLYGGICINGYNNTLIENNVIESCETDGIVYMGQAGGGAGYVTIVRNNIIADNKGYGINNLRPDINSFILEYNDVFNNMRGDYNNAYSNTDIHVEPLYARPPMKAGWHYVVATYDSKTGTFCVYVDGEEKAREQYPDFGDIGSNDEYVYLGAYRGKAYWLYGKLDDVAVWKRALSAEEVAYLWNNGKGNFVSGSIAKDLLAYWQMENNWNDSCGNFDGSREYSTANFTKDSKLGEYAAIFDHTYAIFSNELSPSSAITIAAWVYRDENSMNQDDIQTIFSKGREEDNNHIWLYCQGDNFYLELGNGRDRVGVGAHGVGIDELDFHLKSAFGRWNGSAWVYDNETSLCINSGDPASDYSNEPEPNGGRINIGAYGNTPEASKGSDEPVASANGPYVGIVNRKISFTGCAYSGHPPYRYTWDFGDGSTSIERNPSHEYDEAGNYTLTLVVTDSQGKIATDKTWVLILSSNSPPSKPYIEGRHRGRYGYEYAYAFYSTDPENDSIWYYVDWGDGTNTGWIGPYNSGEKVIRWHTWNEPGDYVIQIKAKDSHGFESERATLKISMPKKILNPFQWILEAITSLFQMLQHVIEILQKMFFNAFIH